MWAVILSIYASTKVWYKRTWWVLRAGLLYMWVAVRSVFTTTKAWYGQVRQTVWKGLISLLPSIIGAAVGAYWGVDTGIAVYQKTQTQYESQVLQALLTETNHNQWLIKEAICSGSWSDSTINAARPVSVTSERIISEGLFFSEGFDTETRQALMTYVERVRSVNSMMGTLEQVWIFHGKLSAEGVTWFDRTGRQCLAATYVLQRHLREYMKDRDIPEKVDEGSKRYYNEYQAEIQKVAQTFNRENCK